MNRKWLIYIVFMFLVSAPSVINAQDAGGGNICFSWYSLDPNNSRVIAGEVNNNQPAQNWTFPGKASTFANIRVEVTDGTLDPLVHITDLLTEQRILTTSSNEQTSDGRRLITIKNLALSSDGDYTITVTRLGEARGATSGRYRLSLEPGLQNTISGNRQDAPIYDSEVVQGPGGALPDAWYFTGRINQVVTIVLNSTGETTSSQPITNMATIFGQAGLYTNATGTGSNMSLIHGAVVEILSEGDSRTQVRVAGGQIGWVASNAIRRSDSSPGGLSLTLQSSSDGETWQSLTQAAGTAEARITNFTLPANSQYAIVVTAPGEYRLTLAGAGGERALDLPCIEPPPECPANSPLGGPSIALDNETPASGNISGASPAIAFQFVAMEGNSVTIRMQRTGGDLKTFVGLANTRGDLLARNLGFDPALSVISDFAIPADACYYAYASREGVGDGTTQGTFTLTVSGIPDSETERPPDPPPGTVFGRDVNPGDTASGAITGTDWQVSYRFRAESSREFTAIATRSSGDLAPALALLDASGRQQDAVTANFVGNASNPLTFRVEAGKYYFIVVRRESGANGSDSGDFTLTLTGN